MPLSVRLDPALEQRLRDASAREGVPVSVVVREAITRHCDEVLRNGAPAADLRTRIADLVGVVESDYLSARRTGDAFTELLLEQKEP